MSLLLLAGLVELFVQASQARTWRRLLPVSWLAIAASYPLALQIALPVFEKALFVTHAQSLIALACVSAALSLAAYLAPAGAGLAARLRRAWLALPSPTGLLALAWLQWSLLHHVDGWPYELLSLSFAGLVTVLLLAARQFRTTMATAVWLALAQMALAVGVAAWRASEQMAPAVDLPGSPLTVLAWLGLLLLCAGGGAMAARRLHWN